MKCPDSSRGAAGTVDFEDAGVGAAPGVVISTSLRVGHSTRAMAMARRSRIEETTQMGPRSWTTLQSSPQGSSSPRIVSIGSGSIG